MPLTLAKEDPGDVLDESYSQATACPVMLTRFQNDRTAARVYHMLSPSRLYGRVVEAIALVREQASLFDRIERNPDDFMPTPWQGLSHAGRAGR